MARRSLLAVLALCWIPGPALAQWSERDYVEPVTVRSHSGELSLRVDPTQPNGRASADYTLSRKGEKVWSVRLPYTLREVALADSGITAGYAYQSDFLVVTIGADGKPLRVHETVRTPSRFADSHDNPLAEGLILQEALDRFVVRIADEDLNSQDESWWVFRLSTGQLQRQIHPRASVISSSGRVRLVGALPVRDAPLILVQWLELAESGASGARFALLDAEFGAAWELDRPGEYAADPEYSILQALYSRPGGAILRCDEARSFELWLGKDRQRAHFEVLPGEAGTWIVRETARAPMAALEDPPPTPPPVVSPDVRLTLAGTIDLGAGTNEPAVRDVGPFAFDGQGNIAFLRWEQNPYRAVLAYVDSQGSPLAVHPLAGVDPKEGSVSGPIEWLRDAEFLVPFSTWNHANRGPAKVLRVSARTGEEHEFASIEGGEIHDLARTPDGGLLVLGDNRLESFAPDGKRRWVRTRADDLCGAANLAVSGEGRIVVLDQGGRALQWIAADGTIGRYDGLDKLHGRKARYLTWIEPDLDGGWMLEDSDTLLRLDKRGRLLGEFAPRFASGRLFKCRGQTRVGPDGRRWASDGHALVALDPDGVVDRILGDAPDADRIGDVVSLQIDAADKIHAASRRSGNVFVFSSSGELLRIAHSAPSDFTSDPDLREESLVLGALGDFFLVAGRKCVHWSSDGKRLGLEERRLGEHIQRQLPQWGSENTWLIAGEALRLAAPGGKALASLTRKPDGSWLQPTNTAVVAADGSIAVVCGDSSDLTAGGTCVAIAGPDGVLKAVVRLGQRDSVPYEIAFDGKRVAGIAGSTLYLCEVATGSMRAFELEGVPKDHTSSWQPFLAHARDELWLFDGQHTLRRYSLSRASAPR